MRDWAVKLHMFMGGKRVLDEDLSQALKLEAAKAAAGLPARLRVVRAWSIQGTMATTGRSDPYAGIVGMSAILRSLMDCRHLKIPADCCKHL
jgi:hypothetical protein